MEASRLRASTGLAAIHLNTFHQPKQPPFAGLPSPVRRTSLSSRGQLRCSHRGPTTREVRIYKVPACGSQTAAEVADGSKDCAASGSGLRRKKLAVFVSGGGSNFRSIHQAAVQGLVHGDVAVVVTDKPGCGGASYAAENGIPVIHFPKSKSSPAGLPPDELVATLRKFEINFVLLAGYLKLLPMELVQVFPKSIFNIHPSLLPAFGGKGFYGMKVHQAVIASGARYSGPTIHFVDENYDTGRILAQRVVPVLANDTADQLAARVLCEEHKLYVDVVCALCEERIIWREDGVPLIRSKENPNKYL